MSKERITFYMKANNNFRAEFNMATYELFKDKLFTTIDSMSSDQSTLLKYTVDNIQSSCCCKHFSIGLKMSSIKRFIPVPLARSDAVEL
jgi:hypothetical protein